MGYRLTAQNSFDRSLRVSFALGLVRLVCTNGMVARDSQSVIKVKHSSQMEDKLQSYVDTQMEEIKSAYTETKQIIYSLAETPVTSTDAKEVINRLFKGESKRAENIRDEVFSRFSKGMGNRGETAWDLVNGITEYQNHGKAHRSSETSSVSENRLTSLTLGADATLMNRVWTECMALN